MSEEELQKRLLDTHWAGQAASLEAAAIEARKKAGFFFSISKDAEATEWRLVAKWLEERADLARKEQAKYR